MKDYLRVLKVKTERVSEWENKEFKKKIEKKKEKNIDWKKKKLGAEHIGDFL